MTTDRRSFAIALASTLVAPCVVAQQTKKPAVWPRAASVPGGVARVPLGAGPDAPLAWLGEQRVLVLREGSEWVALVGIALAERAGSALALQVQRGTARESLAIKVGAKTYASQHLKVPADKVDLSKEDLARFEQERSHLARVIATFSDAPPPALPMIQPVPGPRSNSFGRRRTSTASRATRTTAPTSPRRPARRWSLPPRGACSIPATTSSPAARSSSIMGRGC